MNNFGKNLALWIIVGVLLVALFNLFQSSNKPGTYPNFAFSDFLGAVEDGRVTDVVIQGNTIKGHFSDGLEQAKTQGNVPDASNLGG